MDANEELRFERQVRQGLREDGPSAAFRARVRDSFLGAAADPSEGENSPSQGEEEGRSARIAAMRQIETSLQNLRYPAARAEFKADVRAAFLADAQATGPADDQADLLQPAAPSLSGARVRRGPRPTRSLSTGPFSWQVSAGLLAVAAAVVLMLWIPEGTPEAPAPIGTPTWSLARGEAIEINDELVPASDSEWLSRALTEARTVSTQEGQTATLRLRDEVRFGLESASSLTLPIDVTGADPAEDLAFSLTSGTVHLMTRDGYAGAAIVVETPHAKVRIRASVLSVDVLDGEGSCICVSDGEAEVEILTGDQPKVTVKAGNTCFVFESNGSKMEGVSKGLVKDGHLEPLEAFHADGLREF